MINQKKKQIRNRIIVWSLCLSALILAFGSFIVSSQSVIAGGAAGDDTSHGNKKCYENITEDYPTYQDSCYGATWRLQSVGTAARIDDDKATIAEIDSECSKYGGEYYRLGLEVFRTNGSHNSSNFSSAGYQKRFKTVSEIKSPFGSGNVSFKKVSGSEEWNSVKSNFEAAQAYAANMPNFDGNLKGKDWNSISWFCWNKDWVSTSTESKFNAWSWVDEASTSPNPDSKVTTSKTTSEKSITVNFKHQLSYNRPSGDFSGSTFSAVSTNWNTVVTQDGQPVGINNSGTYNLSSGYPDAATSWSSFYGQTSYTINIPEGVSDYSTTVCSTIYYEPKNIKWKEVSSKKFEVDSSSNKADSQACITIRTNASEEDDTEDGGQIRFWSTSTIEIPSNQKGGDVNYHIETSSSEGNGKVTAKLSTDADTLDVNFWHTLYYRHEARGGGEMPSVPHTGQDKLLDDICTKYDINQSGDARNANKNIESSEEYCVDKDNFTTNVKSDGEKVKKDKYDFHIEGINVGETVTVCQKISFEPEIITMMRTKKTKKVFDGYFLASPFDAKEMEELYFFNARIQDYTVVDVFGTMNGGGMWTQWWYNTDDGTPVYNNTGQMLFTLDWDGNFVPVYYAKYHEELDYYEYHKEDEQGEGYSEACVEVTRPAGATEPGKGVDGPISGNPDVGFMYTGETSDVSWDVEGYHYNTRRLIGLEAIVYEPIVDIPLNSANNYVYGTVGHSPTRTGSSPCVWFSRNGNLRNNWCKVIYNQSSSSIPSLPTTDNNPYHINPRADIVVPDYVGDKYCNSFGFFWQYWYGVTHEVNGTVTSDTWSPESRTYWMNYDAACRTIVKKPSTSFWNGGIFTNGNIATSLSTRYTNPIFGNLASNGGDQKKYGSWTEYLAVVNGEVKDQPFGLASGAALSFNGSDSIRTLLENSPMTIANISSPVGKSGINANSTFRARLASYLVSMSTDDDRLAGITDSSLQGIDNTRVIVLDNGSNGNNPVEIKKNVTIKNQQYSTIYNLPQVVIYSKSSINIASEVTQIDAWIISEKTVNTCSVFKDGDTEAYVANYNDGTDCSNQLIVNGPIIAKDVELNRSAGSDPITYTDRYNNFSSIIGGNSRSLSGEVFNLSADTYLWAYAQAGRYGSSYSEAYTRELPPRY